MYFIHKHEVIQYCFKDVTYGKINCNYREGKVEPNRAQLTAGGDRISDVGTPISDPFTVKLLNNSAISTPEEKWFTIDVRNFYLNTPMARK